ncbi:MAG: PEGA domain-containing protein [Ignavibacteriaceae bacterium]|nr:PEGA domain-containing protein [Ignavibacteriaceae bacterium]
MKRLILGITAAILMTVFSACSTVLNTTTQNIDLKTTPPNANITIDGKKFGTSPQIINIDRGRDHVVRFELDGYDLYEIQLTKKMSSWFWLNALNGFIPGMVIDWFTGSMYYLLPNEIVADLTPAKVEETKKRR